MSFLPGMQRGFMSLAGPSLVPKISHVSSSTEDSYTSGAFSLPAGLAQDDIVIVGVCSDTSNLPSVPSGWTEIDSEADHLPDFLLVYKRMSSSPDTTITFTGQNGTWSVVSQAFRGVSTTTALDVTITSASGGSGDPDPASIAPTTDGCMIVAVGFLDDDTVSGVTAPTGFTNVIDANAASDPNTSMMASLYQETAATASVNAFGTSGDDAWHARTIALRPA